MGRRALPSPTLVVAVVALVAALGGFAVAAVPDRQGRIVACYAKKGGDLRVLTRGTRCRRGEKRLRWSQTGPAGPAGQNGAAGQQGPAGTEGRDGRDGTDGPQGSAAASMLTGNTGNVAANVGVTHYLHPSGISDYWGAHTFADMLSPNVPVVARDLAMSLPNPPGAAGEFYRIALQVDQTDTALTCTITGTTDTACGDSEHAVTIPARSLISFELEVSGGSVSRRIRWGWRAVEPAP
jgi:hypothetical protein